MTPSPDPPLPTVVPVRRRALLRVAAAASALAAFAADFPWGDFHSHTHWAKVGWIPFVSPPVRPFDIVENLLLFAPLGFLLGLESRIGRRRASPAHAALRAALIALFVSFVGEWSQLYSHTRFPSATDVTCNVIGAVVAALIVTWGW